MGRDADRLTRALAWFDEHMDQAPDVAALAGALGIGPAQLRRICLNIRGLKLGTLLDERRLERARALLVDSSLSLAGIARASALSHAMQRRHACSPSELRRRILS